MIETWVLIGVVLVAEGTMCVLLARLYLAIRPFLLVARDPLGMVLASFSTADEDRRAQLRVVLQWIGRQVAAGAMSEVKGGGGGAGGQKGPGGLLGKLLQYAPLLSSFLSPGGAAVANAAGTAGTLMSNQGVASTRDPNRPDWLR